MHEMTSLTNMQRLADFSELNRESGHREKPREVNRLDLYLRNSLPRWSPEATSQTDFSLPPSVKFPTGVNEQEKELRIRGVWDDTNMVIHKADTKCWG